MQNRLAAIRFSFYIYSIRRLTVIVETDRGVTTQSLMTHLAQLLRSSLARDQHWFDSHPVKYLYELQINAPDLGVCPCQINVCNLLL